MRLCVLICRNSHDVAECADGQGMHRKTSVRNIGLQIIMVKRGLNLLSVSFYLNDTYLNLVIDLPM